MAVRPIALLALMTLAVAALAGCSDGPPKGDLVAMPGAVAVEGKAEIEYVAADYPNGNNPVSNEPLCLPNVLPECTDPSSSYSFTFGALPEPSGDGYQVWQVGGAIGERMLVDVAPKNDGTWGATQSKDNENQEGQYDHLELRMGSFRMASAAGAAGSNAFVVSEELTGVKVTGDYNGKTIRLSISGLPGDGNKPAFIGRLYTTNDAGNVTVAESFPVTNGDMEYVSKDANIGKYVQFHIHVDTSAIYVYKATL